MDRSELCARGLPRREGGGWRARCAAFWLSGVFALVAATLPVWSDEATREQSVRPGVNDKYLTPDLDVEEWTKRFETESRELYRARQNIVDALALSSGMAIADVGAGTGLFVGPFARAVGAQGVVYAVDISPRFVEHLKQRVEHEGLEAVRVVQSNARSVELPADSVDVAFVCDVYHHFEYPKAMLASLRAALRPGGALVVVDFERIPGTTRDWVVEHVRAGKPEFIEEMERAGFELEREISVEGLSENYMLRFRAL
jgi:SAM-dependent methyltransferase